MESAKTVLLSESSPTFQKCLFQKGTFSAGSQEVIRRPVAQVVFCVPVIPTDQVEFLRPARIGLGQHADGFDNFVFDVGHGCAPFIPASPTPRGRLSPAGTGSAVRHARTRMCSGLRDVRHRQTVFRRVARFRLVLRVVELQLAMPQ
jgi:hypothetical protein